MRASDLSFMVPANRGPRRHPDGTLEGRNDRPVAHDFDETGCGERFWAKVDRRGDNECWNWLAARVGGYGAFGIGGRTVKAHRVALALVGRKPSVYQDVMHTCDNRGCVNPAHLKACATRENILDMERKGRARHLRGTENGRARLTVEQVIYVRSLKTSGRSTYSVAKEMSVGTGTIWLIWAGRNWKHL